MTNLTISLKEETVRRLRQLVRDHYNSKRGALSGVIEESLRETLDSLDARKSKAETFRALKNEKILAEASTLRELASTLKHLGIDPRSVRIVSSKTLAPIVRMGLRTRRASD